MFRTSLPQLNRDITRAERGVAQQRASIERLTVLGRDTTSARKLLGEMQHQLDTLIERRRRFLQTLDKRP